MTRDADSIQRYARALADPSRFRIFTYVSESTEQVSVAELTELLGFNHNAIRQHLSQLVDAGLVAEEREVRDRPGRPRLLYSASKDALSPFAAMPHPKERLASLLLEMVNTGDSAYVVGKRAGEELSGEGSEPFSIAMLMDVFSTDGFQPTRDGSEIVLNHCPLAAIVVEGQSVVCELHRGIIDGAVAATLELHRKDPYEAGCVVVLPSGLS